MAEKLTISPQLETTPASAHKTIINTQESIYNKSRQSLPIQFKLTVGAVDDPLEHEADAVADKVMRMPDQSFIQRKCAHCEEEEKVQRKPILSFIQKKEAANNSTASDAISNQVQSTKGSGNSMSGTTKSFMESRFGTDLSNINIHTGSYAAQLAKELNAQAFTVGNDIYFNEGKFAPESSEGKHLLAHELTHTLQQAGTVQPKIQRYVVSGGERISDDGNMVVEDHTKNAWTVPAKIDSSNAILHKINSEITLKKLGTKRKQKVPGGATEIELEKYNVEMAVAKTAGDLKKNCGRACLQVLGHNIDGEREFVAVTKNKTTSEFTPTEKYHADDQAPGGVTSTTEELSAHIYIKIIEKEFGTTLTRVDAMTKWKALDAAKKIELSKKYGINEYAIPQVGQGITMGTEFDMPGFKNDAALGRPNDTWNFHFGSPVITSGSDYTTVENFTGSSHDYYFSMFGPAGKSQSWYDEQKKAGFGSDHTAMVVQHPTSLLGHINENSTLLVDSPEVFNAHGTGVRASLSSGATATIVRKGMSWMKITVTSGAHTGKTGWIMNKYFTQ